MNKVAKLRAIFKSLKMEFLPGVHDGQSAQVAEQDGFRGVWVSVAEQMNSAINVTDWLDIIEHAGSLSSSIGIPCLLDIGKGFGDLKNTVAHLHRLGIAGVCIEDGVEPGEPWSLSAVNESCEQVRAAKGAAGNDIFLVARCGALASGRGMQETLDRCYALQKAGADAVLLHSEKAHGLEIAEFMYRWRGTVPVAIISSQYTSVPTQVFDNAGVAVAIRASRGLVTAQTDPDTSGWLHVDARRDGSVEQDIPPLDTVLLHRVREEAQSRYQPG